MDHPRRADLTIRSDNDFSEDAALDEAPSPAERAFIARVRSDRVRSRTLRRRAIVALAVLAVTVAAYAALPRSTPTTRGTTEHSATVSMTAVKPNASSQTNDAPVPSSRGDAYHSRPPESLSEHTAASTPVHAVAASPTVEARPKPRVKRAAVVAPPPRRNALPAPHHSSTNEAP